MKLHLLSCKYGNSFWLFFVRLNASEVFFFKVVFLATPCNKFSPNHPPYDLRFFQPPECIIYAKSTLSCFKSEM